MEKIQKVVERMSKRVQEDHTSVKALSLIELKARCKQEGKKVSGTKDALIARILDQPSPVKKSKKASKSPLDVPGLKKVLFSFLSA